MFSFIHPQPVFLYLYNIIFSGFLQILTVFLKKWLTLECDMWIHQACSIEIYKFLNSFRIVSVLVSQDSAIVLKIT